MDKSLFAKLKAETPAERLSALRALKEEETAEAKGYVNNHIHTIYSFSPYSPAKALYMAWQNGLTTAGIMDHDSVGGAWEFIEGGEILGMPVTVGFECRVDFSGTKFNGRRLNNPDQKSVAYVTLHGIPHQNLSKAEAFLAPLREKRNLRNRKMVERINELTKKEEVRLDFNRDIVPISQFENGGSITERHILFALAKKITAFCGRGEGSVSFLQKEHGISVSEKAKTLLTDNENPYYEYDLLGVLKADLVEKFYIPATDECPDVLEFTKLAREIGGIPAYAYLGDVGDSVTGDKKTQKFEDDFLDELIESLPGLGFSAVTYMPTRNTPAQLERLGALCKKYNLFEISGEDINSPRQSFKNDLVISDRFSHLVTATWALIGHEKAATAKLEDGMFSAKTVQNYPMVSERIPVYYKIGKGE